MAAGNPGRWGLRGQFVHALTCLENVVHRSRKGLNSLFNVMCIEMPEELALAQFLPGWQPTSASARCQPLGAEW